MNSIGNTGTEQWEGRRKEERKEGREGGGREGSDTNNFLILNQSIVLKKCLA